MSKEIMEMLKSIEDKMAEVPELKAKVESIDTLKIEGEVQSLSDDVKQSKEGVEKVEAALENLPEDIRKEVKAYLGSLPKDSEHKEKAGEWHDISKLDHGNPALGGHDKIACTEGTSFRKSFLTPEEINKADQNLLDGTQGSLTNQAVVWSKAVVGDPWVAAGASQINLSAPNFKTVEQSGLNFDTTGASAQPSNQAFDTVIGTVTEQSHSVVTYVMRTMISHNQADDLSGITNHLTNQIVMQYGKKRGALTTAAVQAGSLDANDVASGVSAKSLQGKTPANANFATDVMDKMILQVTDYNMFNPSFVMNHGDALAYAKATRTENGNAINPATGLLSYLDSRIHIDHQAAGLTTNGNHPSFYGAWGNALIQAMYSRLIVDLYMQTIPGAAVYYSAFRFLPVVVDNTAYSQIKVGT